MDIDNNATASGDDLQGEEQDFDLEQEYVEDDDSDSSFNIEEVEDVPTDDELEYDENEDGCHYSLDYWELTTETVEIKPKGYKPDASPPSQKLGEDSKALLLWRQEEIEKSFSDWTIKVVAEIEAGEETVTIYNVHRFALARGPKKCGYFEALLQSGCFSENTDSMCTVKLPEEIAAHFPDFLDYLYAQPFDSKCTINFENWKSMRFLANYFLLPRLTEEVGDFIEEDLKNYDLEHIADYISQLNRDICDDMSRRILPEATVVCAEMVLSIEANSKLLLLFPPAMLRKIIHTVFISEVDDIKCMHVMSLIVTYLEQSVDIDESIFVNYFCEVYGPETMDDEVMNEERNDAVLASRARMALRWFRLIEQKGWGKKISVDPFHHIKRTKNHCANCLSDLIRLSETPVPLRLMERIVKEAPSDVVATLFIESLNMNRNLRNSLDRERNRG